MKVEIEIFADEIVIPLDFNGKKKNFLALGALFVPLKKKEVLIKKLTNSRCLFDKSRVWVWNHPDCPFAQECKNKWHEQNNTEIHHEKIRSARPNNSLIEISKRWIKLLIDTNKNEESLVYFNILYIDLDMLNIDEFGTEKAHENIYNKFFRTLIHYGVKAFFSEYSSVIVKNVYHDEGSMEHHNYFPFLNLHKLQENIGKIGYVENTTIKFLNSDHRSYQQAENDLYRESQLIQFIDLILGTATQNIYYLSNDELKKNIAMIIRPLVSRLLSNPNNKNSSYNYYRKQKISIFPKFPIEKTEIYIQTLNDDFVKDNLRGQFYTDKSLEMPPFDNDQKSLNSFFS